MTRLLGHCQGIQFIFLIGFEDGYCRNGERDSHQWNVRSKGICNVFAQTMNYKENFIVTESKCPLIYCNSLIEGNKTEIGNNYVFRDLRSSLWLMIYFLYHGLLSIRLNANEFILSLTKTICQRIIWTTVNIKHTMTYNLLRLIRLRALISCHSDKEYPQNKLFALPKIVARRMLNLWPSNKTRDLIHKQHS